MTRHTAVTVIAVMAGAIVMAANAPLVGARATRACKTWGSEVRFTDHSPTGQTVQLWRTAWDGKAFDLTTDGTYKNAAGTNMTTKWVTHYNSVDDFIRETTVVPPLKLYRTVAMTINGKGAVTTTNSFDAQGRLTGFISSATGPSAATVYSAWDNLGRPTAGTQGPPSNRESLVLVYDNAARTLTTTYAGSTRMVSKETFDANGNPTRTDWTLPTGTSAQTYEIQKTETTCR